jgi:hypothetical protein
MLGRRFRGTVPVLAALALLLCGAGQATAQLSITIAADERGNGLLTNTSGFRSPLPSGLGADPGPGGLPMALIYGLLSPPGLVAGDLLVLEPGTNALGDIIRFNPAQNGGSMVFYSAAGSGDLGDTGFPTTLYANTITVSEGVNGVITYTPTAGQPGFVAGAGGPVTYVLTSDAVPEPTSLALLAAGGAALAGWRCLRRKPAAA